MLKITLNIDKTTLEKMEKSAKAEDLSISKWVIRQLKKSLKADYPADFESLFGSIKGERFTEPEQLSVEADFNRETF